MSAQHPTNMAASVRQRLLNLARAQNEDFTLLLRRYVLERLLFRLGRFEFRDQFILKGAMLFLVWSGQPHRPTHDLDLLGYGANSVRQLEKLFRELVRRQVEPDGVVFDPETVIGTEIRIGKEYEGVRLKMVAQLGQARIPVQVDVGFGDSISPPPEDILFPTLLDFPAPTLRAYRRETVIAEKYHAMVSLGMTNTRLKDFFDIWFMATNHTFGGQILAIAIQSTFERRRTRMTDREPLALTATFSESPLKNQQWKAFIRKLRLEDASRPLPEMIAVLRQFLLPVAGALAGGQTFSGTWPPGGPWQPGKD